MSSYDHYVKDTAFLASYNDYQQRYATQIAERDKIILNLIRRATDGKQTSVLDIGCSTGNLILHAKRLMPHVSFVGGELAESSLAAARANPELLDVRFEKMDMLDIRGKYDVIVANAVAVYFDWSEYEKAIASVARALNQGGTYIAFEWLHQFANQDIAITETTRSHPEGLKIHFRPQARVWSILERHGFASVDFIDFEIPVDLAFNGFDDGDATTHTKQTPEGRRMQFRGILYQPWCHMVARLS